MFCDPCESLGRFTVPFGGLASPQTNTRTFKIFLVYCPVFILKFKNFVYFFTANGSSPLLSVPTKFDETIHKKSLLHLAWHRSHHHFELYEILWFGSGCYEGTVLDCEIVSLTWSLQQEHEKKSTHEIPINALCAQGKQLWWDYDMNTTLPPSHHPSRHPAI